MARFQWAGGGGGAVTGNSDELLDRCQAFHNCGRAFGNFNGEKSYFTRGSNYDLKGNRQVCATAVGMTQNLLLADRSHMDLIAEAIHKIHTHSAVLART